MKILICEDDIMTLKALDYHLKKNGYETTTTSNGLEAKKEIEQGGYDLLLCDIHMPYISGLELVNHVRTKLKNNLPILILTRIGRQETVHEAFKLGADDYITKPFNPDDLTERIKKLLERNGKTA